MFCSHLHGYEISVTKLAWGLSVHCFSLPSKEQNLASFLSESLRSVTTERIFFFSSASCRVNDGSIEGLSHRKLIFQSHSLPIHSYTVITQLFYSPSGITLMLRWPAFHQTQGLVVLVAKHLHGPARRTRGRDNRAVIVPMTPPCCDSAYEEVSSDTRKTNLGSCNYHCPW